MTRQIRDAFVAALIIGGLLGSLLVSSAGAIDSQGIGALPANPQADNPRTKSIFVYDLAAGSTTQDGIKVINNTTSRKTILVYPVDSVPSSDGAFACAQQADPVKSVGSWIKLQQTSVTLDSYGTQVIPFTVIMPDKVDVGEHNGCIVIQEDKNTLLPTKSGVSLSFRSALRVAVTVPGKLVANLRLKSVSQQPGNDNSYVVTSVYENTGNISLDTKINARFSNIFGGTVSQAAGGNFPVLRDSKGTFNFEIKKPFWGGLYKRVVTTSYKPISTVTKNAPAPKSLPDDESLVLLSPQPAGLLIELFVLGAVVGGAGYVLNRRRTHQMILKNSSSYTVKKGDNIQEIAGRYNLNWKRLARVNGLRAPYTLEPGQKLHVPAKQTQNKAQVSE